MELKVRLGEKHYAEPLWGLAQIGHIVRKTGKALRVLRDRLLDSLQ